MRITDGRKKDGKYQGEKIAFFMDLGVDTRGVIEDTYFIEPIMPNNGYTLEWTQAVVRYDGSYASDADGNLIVYREWAVVDSIPQWYLDEIPDEIRALAEDPYQPLTGEYDA